VTEAVIVLEEKNGLAGEGFRDGVPGHCVREVDIEICDDRLALPLHVRRRWKVSLLDILQLLDQGLLRRTTGTGVPLDRPLIDHDPKSEAGMSLCLGHHQPGRLVNAVVRPIPINNDALNAAADHVADLTMHLRGIV